MEGAFIVHSKTEFELFQLEIDMIIYIYSIYVCRDYIARRTLCNCAIVEDFIWHLGDIGYMDDSYAHSPVRQWENLRSWKVRLLGWTKYHGHLYLAPGQKGGPHPPRHHVLHGDSNRSQGTGRRGLRLQWQEEVVIWRKVRYMW